MVCTHYKGEIISRCGSNPHVCEVNCVHTPGIEPISLFHHISSSRCLLRPLLQLGCPYKAKILSHPYLSDTQVRAAGTVGLGGPLTPQIFPDSVKWWFDPVLK